MSRQKYRVEAQEPCGKQAWVELHPAAYYADETGEHDGLFVAESEEAAIKQWLKAYPAYPYRLTGGAKPYLGFRAEVAKVKRTFRLVEVKP